MIFKLFSYSFRAKPSCYNDFQKKNLYQLLVSNLLSTYYILCFFFLMKNFSFIKELC